MIRNRIEIIVCKDKKEASEKAFDLLLNSAHFDTLLLLSGGTSPDLLYQLAARNKTLKPGAVALIDERFGAPMHDNSNEKMITKTGLVDYLNKRGISFYKILVGSDMETTARQYEQTIKRLFKRYPKKIAIMGIGADGHTAGIKPDLEYNHSRLVVAYNDAGSFGKRVTSTFEALDNIDEFIVLVFGENKRKIIGSIFEEHDQKHLPAVFFTNTSAKVTLLTDIF